VLPDAASGQGPGTLAGPPAGGVTVQGGYGGVFAVMVQFVSEQDICQGAGFLLNAAVRTLSPALRDKLREGRVPG